MKRQRTSDEVDQDGENDDNHDQPDHVVRKICKHFARGLVDRAAEVGWENEELARLIMLAAGKLDYGNKKTLKFLSKCNVRNASIFACLEDEGLQIGIDEKIFTLHAWSDSIDHFIGLLSEALDANSIHSYDTDTIEAVRIPSALPSISLITRVHHV
jgi:hypothetical protein